MWRTMQAEPSTSVPYMAHDAVKVLNLYFASCLLGNLIQNDDFSGEIFAIYFIFLKDVVFVKIIM